jgi:hypothetical protein
MAWIEPWLRDETVGFIAAGVGGVALLAWLMFACLSLWVRWRASRLSRIARRYTGRHKLAEELLSSMDAEEKDLNRLMKEMEKAAAKA